MQFDLLACLGRFQIFHNGHKAMVDRGLELASVVVLGIGSHDQPRDSRNPLSTEERIEMITAVYPEEVASGRIVFLPLTNTLYNDPIWVNSVRKGVAAIARKMQGMDELRIGLIGHSKDASSYYLGIFPGWEGVEVPNVGGIDATTLRNAYFQGSVIFNDMVPPAVERWLTAFHGSAGYITVRQEYLFNAAYKKPYKKLTDSDFRDFMSEYSAGRSNIELLKEFDRQYRSPYAPTFHTVDAVVTQSNHILLVERGAMPGKGLWALPGGFLEQGETLRNGMLRELEEETKIALSKDTLERCIRSWRTFDDPNRSSRGRTITTAFHVELRNAPEFPKIKGSDDAAKARWIPLDRVKRSMMFEDHYDIIAAMTGAIN